MAFQAKLVRNKVIDPGFAADGDPSNPATPPSDAETLRPLQNPVGDPVAVTNGATGFLVFRTALGVVVPKGATPNVDIEVWIREKSTGIWVYIKTIAGVLGNSAQQLHSVVDAETYIRIIAAVPGATAKNVDVHMGESVQ